MTKACNFKQFRLNFTRLVYLSIHDKSYFVENKLNILTKLNIQIN